MPSDKPTNDLPGDIEPYVPAWQTLPEFTVQAVILGIVLALTMCAANIYAGLYAGMTVSAAIPASVISMGVLRGVLRRGTILENNVVHTIAGAGESLAAGIIFTVPAIVLLGLWDGFNYLETTLIAMAGGVMGVVMMIPLRRSMIIEQKELRFPEGVACAEVLKAGDRGGAEMLGIFVALGLGALFKSLVSVVGLFKGTVEGAWQVGRTAFYVGTDVSPMLMAVGFIVGWEVSLLIFLGGAISFVGALPVLAYNVDFGGQDLVKALVDTGGIWDTQIRFFGIGAMLVAGVYSILKISGTMGSALRTAIRGVRGLEDAAALPRTEQGITGRWLLGLMAVCFVLSAVVYALMTRSAPTVAVTTVTMFVLAFFFVAVASYIVGLVGASNSPVSGMTICTVLLTAGLLLVLGYTGAAGMLATLGVAGVVCCAACTSGDICQDLKIGQIVGATPRCLQRGEILGAIIAAFIIAPTMQLLQNAYGIGQPAREGVAALKAPQAMMFKALVSGIFGAERNLPWDLVAYGAAVGVAAILIDRLVLQPRGTKFRLHAMPLAVGMYLPWTVTFPILLGGLVYQFVEWRSRARGDSPETRQAGIHRGLLFSSGLVAGEAIMGILIALLMMTPLKMPLLEEWPKGGLPVDLVSLVALAAVMGLLVLKSLGKGTGRTG
jgi:putative OPT family oligopeptide transporter